MNFAMPTASCSLARHLTIAAIALCSLSLAPSLRAAPFTNGSFESPGGPPETDVVLPQGTSTYITGWTVHSPSANSTVYESGANRQFVAQDGVWVVSFGHNGTAGATLSQTFDTVPGTPYTINYWVSRIQGGTSPQSGVAEAIDATNSQVLRFEEIQVPSENNTWTKGRTLAFTATSSSTVVQFRDTTFGGSDSNWALDNVTVNDGTNPTPTPTPAKTAPKGKLGTTFFGARQHGNVMQFTSLVVDAAASFSVRVQATTTPGNESSWQDLPNGFAGRMIRDYSYEGARAYSLNSTHYPQQNGVHFRAIASAAGYADSISDADGPFELASNTARAGTVTLRIPELIVTPNAFMRYIADVNNRAPDTTVRVQSSSTPGDESSWTDVTSLPFRAGSDDYRGRTNEYPTGRSLYFRAVASAPGRVDSLSNSVGDFDLKRVPVPTVRITSPFPSAGGSGATMDDPIVLGEGQRYPITFNFSASASSSGSAPIKVIRLIYDGVTIHRAEGVQDTTVQYTTSVPGDHRLRAVALTTEFGQAELATLHIRIAPEGGRVFRCLGGDWNNANTWRDGAGNPGVPGPRDHAIVRNVDVSLSASSTVAAVTLNGGSIAGPGELTITGRFVLGPGQLRNLALTVERGGTFSLTSDTDVAFSGRLINRGTFISEGRGNIVGLPTSGGTSELARLNNQADFFLQGGGTLVFAADGSTDSGRIAALSLIGNDGSGVINQDGSGVINQDGSGVINQDGSGFISDAGSGILSEQVGGFVAANGSIITHDGSSFVSTDGGSFVSNNGATFISNNSGTLVFRSAGGAFASRSGAHIKAAENGAGLLKMAGEIDFGSPTSTTIAVVGDVTMEGGVLTGTGTLFGSLQQNGGFISPGSSAGAIGVTGDYTQGPDAALVSEVGGPHSRQFDQLVVGGMANVNGKLTLRAINGYVPEADATFSPLAYGTGSGSFTTSGNAQMTLGATGLLGTLDPNVAPPPAAKLLNIATRLRVEQGENALIGGFIITGSAPKRVIVRALGPSLSSRGIAGGLADPTLELFTPNGSTFNNNWRDSQPGAIEATTIAPSDDREAAIVATLDAGVAYTAVVRGLDDTTGVGLVEVYDLDSPAASTLANISTRGLVQTGENVMIGGIIIGGDQPAKVLVRALGPSLADQGVSGALDDPTLELNDANGNAISNDDWQETQEEQIVATTVFPTNSRESAIVATLTPGNYTAIVRGKGDTTGVALVEAYNLQ